MGWFADVAHGALAPGVNAPTLALFNVAAVGAAASLAALLATPAGAHPAVWPHVVVGLALCGGVIVGVNWVVAAGGGLADPADQRRALGLDENEAANPKQD